MHKGRGLGRNIQGISQLLRDLAGHYELVVVDAPVAGSSRHSSDCGGLRMPPTSSCAGRSQSANASTGGPSRPVQRRAAGWLRRPWMPGSEVLVPALAGAKPQIPPEGEDYERACGLTSGSFHLLCSAVGMDGSLPVIPKAFLR